MQTMYGIDPPAPSVVNPPPQGDNIPDNEPLTTNRESTEFEETE